jgi:hypothetical protein
VDLVFVLYAHGSIKVIVKNITSRDLGFKEPLLKIDRKMPD